MESPEEFARGRGLPNLPFMMASRDPRGGIPCCDFSPWILRALRANQIEIVWRLIDSLLAVHRWSVAFEDSVPLNEGEAVGEIGEDELEELSEPVTISIVEDRNEMGRVRSIVVDGDVPENYEDRKRFNRALNADLQALLQSDSPLFWEELRTALVSLVRVCSFDYLDLESTWGLWLASVLLPHRFQFGNFGAILEKTVKAAKRRSREWRSWRLPMPKSVAAVQPLTASDVLSAGKLHDFDPVGIALDGAALNTRWHLFEILEKAQKVGSPTSPVDVSQSTRAQTRRMGIDIAESIGELIRRGLVCEKGDTLQRCVQLTRAVLERPLVERGIRVPKSWPKHRVAQQLVRLLPDHASELAASVRTVAITDAVAASCVSAYEWMKKAAPVLNAWIAFALRPPGSKRSRE